MLFDFRGCCFLPSCDFQNSAQLLLFFSLSLVFRRQDWVVFSLFSVVCPFACYLLAAPTLVYELVPLLSPLQFSGLAPFTHTTKLFIGKYTDGSKGESREGMRRPRARIVTPFSFFWCVVCFLRNTTPLTHSTNSETCFTFPFFENRLLHTLPNYRTL